MPNHWLGVVSKAHVLRGVAGGFAQVCHGKRGPLSKMKPGDGLVYYSPGEAMGERSTLKAFTAIGWVKDERIYCYQMTADFVPFRRDVAYAPGAKEIAVEQLKSQLDLTAGPHWGYALRRGLLPLSARDFALIAQAMGVGAGSPQVLL
jgi:EVE domain